MKTNSFSRLVRAVLMSVFLIGANLASGAVFNVNVDSIFSFDPLGYPDNTILTVDLASLLGTSAPILVDGVGWDVSIYTEAGSWLSEAHISVQDADSNILLDIAPGINDTWYGAEDYTSSGIVDLTSDGLQFTLSDGILLLEFYESYNDYSPQPEAIWFGSLQIRANAIPLPPSAFLLVTAIVMLAAGRHGVRLFE